MAFDSFSLRLIIDELKGTILGGQIRHIEQINATDITLKISGSSDTFFLLLSAHSVYARAHLIPRSIRNPSRSHFADFLMKHLMRGSITQIEQVGLDRILIFDIQPTGVVEANPKRLIGEFMGKHSNLILVDADTGKILESIKHVDENMSRKRQILPGLAYVSPPMQDKHDPFTLTRELFASFFEDASQRDPSRVILRNVDGFSPVLAREVVLRTLPDPSVDELWEAYQTVIEDLGSPHVFIHEEDVVDVAPLRLHIENAEPRRFDSMCEALHFYHTRKIEREKENSQRHALMQSLERRRNAIEEKISSLEVEMAQAENADQFRILGELINANLHRIQRGQKQVEVQNYYEAGSPRILIDLDPALLPAQNAQRYFKRYTKAKRSKSILANLIGDQEAQLQRLDYYREKVENAQGVEALMRLREEFIKQGLLADPQKRRKKSAEEKSFRRYTSLDGYSIYVGRSTRENDLLTLRIANKHDMWLHAKQIPGSHVIIRNPEKKQQIPMPTLLEAARAAAFFSRAGKSGNVPVDYTWVKYVTKPKGSVPGYVHYTHEKTLYVDPERPRGSNSRGRTGNP